MSSVHFRQKIACLGVLLLCAAPTARAEAPSIGGVSGLIQMPSARIAADGAFRMGWQKNSPYSAGWASIAFLPRVEGTFSFVTINGVPGFVGNDAYGDFKDKSLGIKVLALAESGWLPAVAVGLNDIEGTGLFAGQYLVANKQVSNLDFTLGVGRKRIDGVFGGLRYSPDWAPDWSLVAEYDANDYRKDRSAAQTGLLRRDKRPALGVEYRWGWLGAQVATRGGDVSVNAYVTVPLHQREYVPKVDEPQPFLKLLRRPSADEWAADAGHRARLLQELTAQDFRNIQVDYRDGRLEAVLTNRRIADVSRAVGRAARVLLALAPVETREIVVTYTIRDMAVATYSFFDVPLLQRYFNGLASRAQLAPHVGIRYGTPDDLALMAGSPQEDTTLALAAFSEAAQEPLLVTGEDGEWFSLRVGDGLANQLKISPGLSFYLNDPSGAFRYDTSLQATAERRFDHGLSLAAAAKLSVFEDVSAVNNPSNSLLPHVRTDIAEYRRAGRLKLNRLLLNQWYQPAERVFARLSAGIYEEMFGGVGGQLLYTPKGSPWTVDLAVDALRQRDFEGGFGFQRYSTLTALASLNYRLPEQMTATVRVGRFLAKDEGARFELKRRFRSGIEFGAWYTWTNGRDITSPGTPASPYFDKGVFVSMPLNGLLTKDSQAKVDLALTPWTRDVGQMVASPGDLFTLLENGFLNLIDGDGLHRLGDVDDDYPVAGAPAAFFDQPWGDRMLNDGRRGASLLGQGRFWRAATLGTVATVASAGLDSTGDRLARRYAANRWLKGVAKVGNAMPIVAMAASGLTALNTTDARLANTGVASVQAGVSALLIGQGLKYAVGRGRPELGLGARDFDAFGAGASDSSFPSRHTAVMWAAVTPYAKEYDAPWLYGLAAVTNFARVRDRKHWFSDTVAGSLIGYGLGHLFWQWRRTPDAPKKSGESSLEMTPDGVAVAWAL